MSDTVTDATVKQVNKPNVDGGKKSADNTNQRKLTEARDILKGRYAKIAMLDSDGKKTKVTMGWEDIFNQAGGDAQTAHLQLVEAKETYSSESDSIAQLFLSIARISKNADVFATDYKNMAFVWKTTNNVTKLPQAIVDAASVIKRSWRHKLDPTKAASITSLRAELKAHVKADKVDDSGTVDIDKDTADTMKLLTQIAVALKAENMLQEYADFLGQLKAVAQEYIEEESKQVTDEVAKLEDVIDADMASAVLTDDAPSKEAQVN